MKATCFIAAIVVMLSGCSHDDPIDRLMAKVSHERVGSYLFTPINLPETASPEQLIAALYDRGHFHDEHLTDIKIVEIRAVQTRPRDERIPAESYTAVLLDTSAGRKIMLFQPIKGGWYFKMYDAK